MQEGHRGIVNSCLQLFVGEGHPHVLAVEGEAERALVHVEADPQNAFLLEALAVSGTSGIGAMSELP